jgi:predicted RNA methylase
MQQQKDKRDFLFRYISIDKRYHIKYDNEALYSTTDQVTANKISKEILKFASKDSVITDATACIGGSALALSKCFKKVYAIELDKNRYELLVHNMNLLDCNNVICINNNALLQCSMTDQDIIFLDPPWGGPEYKKEHSLDLFISNIPFYEVCITFSKLCNFIVIKVPINFNQKSFIENTNQYLKLLYKNEKLRKMHLLIFSTIHNTNS